MFTIEIDTSEAERDWADACRALSDGVRAGVEQGVTEAASDARGAHRYQDHTGALTASIRGYVEASTQGGAVGVLEATAKHASFVEEGTAAHEIRPKMEGGVSGPARPGQGRRGKKDVGTTRVALRWVDGGETHFARVVHHPGGRSIPFIGPAAQKAERVIEREVGVAEVKAAAIMAR